MRAEPVVGGGLQAECELGQREGLHRHAGHESAELSPAAVATLREGSREALLQCGEDLPRGDDACVVRAGAARDVA